MPNNVFYHQWQDDDSIVSRTPSLLGLLFPAQRRSRITTESPWPFLQGRSHCTFEGVDLCIFDVPRSTFRVRILLQSLSDLLLALGLDQHDTSRHVWAFSLGWLLGKSGSSKDHDSRVNLRFEIGQMRRSGRQPLVKSAGEVGHMDEPLRGWRTRRRRHPGKGGRGSSGGRWTS